MPLARESVPIGLVVEMDLPELGLTDLAWVTDIADCPEIESRDSVSFLSTNKNRFLYRRAVTKDLWKQTLKTIAQGEH